MAYLDTSQAASHLGVSRQFLEKLRHTGGGPEFIRVTKRCIRYECAALDQWMAERTAQAVSDYRDGAEVA